jgi:L-lactate dehydrogenase complex protein LldF
MHNQAGFDFGANVEKALSNERLRGNLDAAMTTLREKRLAVFTDPVELEHLRAVGSAIKQRALCNLPKLLVQLEENCTRNGIQVHWAETTAEANAIVMEIAQRHQATRVVKGKSMVSEEMHLNAFLADHGIESMETDLGEFIIQLAGEPPSHIIVPAIHKNKDEVAHIFHEKIPDTPYTEVVEELNAIARQTLRKKFFDGQIGLSGVNFAVAETGTLLLVENEGNGRMCTTVPPVHIAVMGLEKVVEKLADLPPLLRLLTGSATGQLITTYVNMITSPRREGEKDGPREVHLVILDNGRSRIYADPLFRQTLQCIRCGTCLNHCPVYTRIGGHAYGFVYPGPIGKILTPQMEGLEKAGVLATASSLCNACEAVCPVKIPIPALFRRLRNRAHDPSERPASKTELMAMLLEAMSWKGWALVNRHPRFNTLATKIAAAAKPLLGLGGPLKRWTGVRTAPPLAIKTLHERVLEEGGVQDE